jgi:SAM-dependent methyltransferase
MPTVDENKRLWDGWYRWDERGDEWSEAWGGPSMQWYGTILPRIHSLVPADCILEIACGYGRWTQFLKDLCHNLVVIDLSEECVSACRERFADCSHIEYYVNDGRSLDMVAHSSIDFAFSFDSLVHADESVLRAYISQLPRILTEEGAAFLHHSNLGEYQAFYASIRRVRGLESLLTKIGLLDSDLHQRDFGVSSELVRELAEAYGLSCTSQEIVPWGTRRTRTDCFSTITRSSAHSGGRNVVLRNDGFMQEVEYILRLSQLYTD